MALLPALLSTESSSCINFFIPRIFRFRISEDFSPFDSVEQFGSDLSGFSDIVQFEFYHSGSISRRDFKCLPIFRHACTLSWKTVVSFVMRSNNCIISSMWWIFCVNKPEVSSPLDSVELLGSDLFRFSDIILSEFSAFQTIVVAAVTIIVHYSYTPIVRWTNR